MQIFIKDLTGKLTEINAEPYNTIEDIKNKIYIKNNIGIEQQSLYYCGKMLFNNYILDDYNIQKESKLDLYLTIRGGGIPKYYANIIKKYPEVVISPIKIDHFYIDFNAMVYQCLPDIPEVPNNTVFENSLIKKVIEKLKADIISINPVKSVYIASDGSAPLGKIIQQRSRRYKTILEKTLMAELSLSPVNKWSTSNISPGTSFMKNMSVAIRNELKNLGIKYTFSSDTEAGEGEHKIINNMKMTHTDKNDTYLISSPDNDLIVLLLPLKMRTYILKDTKIDDSIIRGYMDVNKFLQIMYSEYSDPNTDMYRFAEDYRFLTFLCGNDFCKPVPYLKVKESNEVIFDEYRIIYEQTKEHIINGTVINLNFLTLLIKNISLQELDLLKKIQKKMHRVRKINIDTNADPDIDPDEQLRNDFQHRAFYSPLNPFHDRYNYLFNKIDYFSDNYVDLYNKYYFSCNDINIVCNEYIKSLQYNLLYYSGQVDYNYAYQYRTAPLFICLAQIDLTKVNLKMNLNSQPLKPYEQLMLILPKDLLYILPKKIVTALYSKDELSTKILRSYKTKIEIDAVQGEKWIYSEALLPHITPEHIQDIRTFLAKIQ